MKTLTINTSLDKLQEHKELVKSISNERYYDMGNFFNDATRYVNAINEGRIIGSIGSVSKSGMSRTIKFLECHKAENENRYIYLNFNLFFRVMGFSQVKSSDYFRINGCGMDMIFHTNYTIINRLCRFDILFQDDANHLAQQTPNII